ncbi:MAG: hypothetical protein FWD42_08855 [Solirubrobacterales bacterium]|nr:hypothetical protein [Solirubrobacterales bacterium]
MNACIRSVRSIRGVWAVLGTLAICGCLPGAAAAANTASLHASFSPDRLGAGTTIAFGFELGTTENVPPPPLVKAVIRMPAGMNYTTTTLGLAICEPGALQAKGAAGCPTNSRLGTGSAFVEVPFGKESGHELPEIQAFMGPPHNGNLVVLFYANGQEPVFAQLVFSGELVPSTGAFGANLDTSIPLIPSVPNGPPVSIVKVETTIGPGKLVYTKHVKGRLVHFHPLGISVPSRCPKGGFPFSAEFQFLGGSTAQASATVPCPPPVKHVKHRRHR